MLPHDSTVQFLSRPLPGLLGIWDVNEFLQISLHIETVLPAGRRHPIITVPLDISEKEPTVQPRNQLAL